MRFTARDAAAGMAALAIATVCVRLGVWQVHRLGERRTRNAEIAARLALPPLTLTGRDVPADSARQRRIVAYGIYDYAHERVWPGRSFQGTPGVALVTPLRFADGSAVLVDRGWVPSPDAFHVDPTRYRERDTAIVQGIGIMPPQGLGDSLGYPALSFVIQDQTPPPSAGLPRRWPPPVLDDGPHLSYAIQWFSFALIVLVGTGVLLRKSASATILGPF
jgi:surfeit locus 1 family protein